MRAKLKFKRTFFFVVFAIVCLPLIHLTWVPNAIGAGNSIVLKMAVQKLPPDVTEIKASNYAAQLIKDRSNGEVEVQVYPGTLADGPALWTSAQEGVADLVQTVSVFISGRVKDIAAFEVLGICSLNRFEEIAIKIRPIMTKIFEQQGIKYLGACNTFTGWVWASNQHHYRSLEDFKGQKLRVPGFWWNKTLKALGGTPTMILPPEIYTAMQRGVVDGAGSVISLITLFKLYEVGPYITEWKNMNTVISFFGMNMQKFNTLPKQYQDIILGAFKDTEAYSYKYGSEMEDKLRNELRAKAKYLSLTRDEIQPILEKVEPIKAEIRSFCGPLGNELMDTLEKIK